MLLAIDVGNTETVIGLFSPGDDATSDTGQAPRVPPEPVGLTHHWRLSTVPNRTRDEYAVMLTQILDLEGLLTSLG